jgi:hypothetical protein
MDTDESSKLLTRNELQKNAVEVEPGLLLNGSESE